MSKINAKGQLAGATGPVYFRMLNGKMIMQSLPKKHKKAAVTKANAGEFGLASRISKNLRTALFPILMDMADVMMYKRFVAVVHHAIKSNHSLDKGSRTLIDGDLALLNNFEMNSNSPFAQYCHLQPEAELSGQRIKLSVTAPEGNAVIKAPEAATSCELCIHICVSNPETTAVPFAEQFRMELPLRGNATPLSEWLSSELPAGQLALVTASLLFYRQDPYSGRITLSSRALHPCSVIGAFRTV